MEHQCDSSPGLYGRNRVKRHYHHGGFHSHGYHHHHHRHCGNGDGNMNHGSHGRWRHHRRGRHHHHHQHHHGYNEGSTGNTNQGPLAPPGGSYQIYQGQCLNCNGSINLGQINYGDQHTYHIIVNPGGSNAIETDQQV